MKLLHRPDLFSWSAFDEGKNVDFNGTLWVREGHCTETNVKRVWIPYQFEGELSDKSGFVCPSYWLKVKRN